MEAAHYGERVLPCFRVSFHARKGAAEGSCHYPDRLRIARDSGKPFGLRDVLTLFPGVSFVNPRLLSSINRFGLKGLRNHGKMPTTL
jgi:hypothetical protein